MGCLFADALARSGCKSTLIMRAGTKQKALPVIVERDNVRYEQQLDIVSPDGKERISHLLVTTKAYDVREAVASVVHRVTKDSVVLLMANGMGFAEQVGGDWPHLNIYCGSTTEGAYSIERQHIFHAGRGETRIGRAGQKEPPPWFIHWEHAIDGCVWDENIETALWSKPLCQTPDRQVLGSAAPGRSRLVGREAIPPDRTDPITYARSRPERRPAASTNPWRRRRPCTRCNEVRRPVDRQTRKDRRSRHH